MGIGARREERSGPGVVTMARSLRALFTFCQVLCIAKYTSNSAASTGPEPSPLRAVLRDPGLSRIPPTEGVPADSENVEEHLHAVTEHADFRGRGVSPAHGNLDGAQAMAQGAEQQLRVEAEPLDGLLLENNPASLAKEGFEAALGVDKRQPQGYANDFVEQHSSEFAEGRLVHSNQAAVDGARANGHVEVFEGIDELVGFFDRRGEIGVGK